MNDHSTPKPLSLNLPKGRTQGRPVTPAVIAWFLASLTLLGQSTIQFPPRYAINVDEDQGSVLIRVERTNALDTIVTVEYATSDDTATAGQDYTPTSGTLTFAAGDSAQTFSVPILNDGQVEDREEFTVTLANPGVGAVLSARSATSARIMDNDLGLHCDAATHYTVEDIGAVRLRVIRGDDGDQPVTVDYATADGTALAGTDYAATNGALRFETDETTKEISVVILNDGVSDPDKSFEVRLSGASNGPLGIPHSVTVIIQDPTPMIYTQPTAASQSVSLGATATIQVSAKGAVMQWQYRTGEDAFMDVEGATGMVLELSDVTMHNAGEYRFIVSNHTGDSVVSDTAILTVDPTFTKLQPGPDYPMLEDRANFSGAAWGDCDRDGDLDLLVTSLLSGNQLYRNLLSDTGKAYFVRLGREANFLRRMVLDYSAAWADFDNDGDLDVVYNADWPASLYRNENGEFVKVSDDYFGQGFSPVGVAWGELDNDGWVDFVVLDRSELEKPRSRAALFMNRTLSTTTLLLEVAKLPM